MANTAPSWAEIKEFNQFATKIITKYPERFSKIDPELLVGYACTNKDKPEASKKPPYELKGSTEPESFTNTKKYFFTVFLSDWEGRSEESKLAIVFAALSRIDPDDPESGKVLPYNYRDQDVMVRTFGPDWHLRGSLPNLLSGDIRIADEPNFE